MTDATSVAWRAALHTAIDRCPEPTPVLDDEVAEYAALEVGAALHLRAGRGVWQATGSDTVDYLHRMLTQDVSSLQVGQGARGCLLEPKGRVLGDFVLWRRGDGLLLDAEPLARTQALPRLEQFVIADDVEFAEVTAAYVRFVLAGPALPEVLESLQLPLPAVGEVVERLHPESGAAVLLQGALLGAEGAPEHRVVEGLAPRDGAHAWLESWIGIEALRPVGERAFEAWRIAAGEPVLGHELRTDALFNEAGLERAVSWSKGCYPGQEPVVMARHRGRPPNGLVRLRVREGTCPDAGTELLRGGKPAGRITSSATRPGADEHLLLALVRTAYAADGAPFDLPDGRSAHAAS